jgi:protein SCO1/2
MRKLRNILTLGILLVAAAQGYAQALPDNVGQASTGMPAILQNVTFRPALNAQLPVAAPLTDENGKSVTLEGYLHQQKPVLLAFVYYGCPMLCTQLEQGVVGSLRMLSFNPGRDYDVVFVSFDDRDTPEMAASKKRSAMEHFRRPETASGWHFLTGSKESIAAVTNAANFHFNFDTKNNLFAHASGIMLLTPDGHISRYFYGVEFPGRDLAPGAGGRVARKNWHAGRQSDAASAFSTIPRRLVIAPRFWASCALARY